MTFTSKYEPTNLSFSGCDMVASVDLTLPDGKSHIQVMGSLQTITYSVHMDKHPVRSFGNVNAKDYVFGPRTIAGSLIFAVFNRHVAYDILGTVTKAGELETNYHLMMDEMPPFNVTISFANEYGIKSRLALYGVRIINEGQTMSVNDIYTENTYQFVATDIEYLNNSTGSSSHIKVEEDKYKEVLNKDNIVPNIIYPEIEKDEYVNIIVDYENKTIEFIASNKFFEVTDKDEIAIKRGEVKDKISINLMDNFNKVFIKDENNIILFEVLIKKDLLLFKKEHPESFLNPITVINMKPNSIELFCNTFKHGHDKLNYYENSTPEAIHSKMLNGPKVTIDLSAGHYIFYMTQHGTKEYSRTKEVIIFEESNSELINEALNSIENYNNYHIIAADRIRNKISEINDSISLYGAAIEVYNNAENFELLRPAYDLISAIGKIINERVQKINGTEGMFTITRKGHDDTINLSNDISRIITYEISDKRKVLINTIDTTNKKWHNFIFESNKKFMLELYNNSALISVMNIFSPNAEIKAQLWFEFFDNLF